MRILIITHAPLSREFGASQIALNLGEALRTDGNDVTLWSPHPLDPHTRWWRTLPAMRSRLDSFLKQHEPFDVIDCPASFITSVVGHSATVVARNTQPELLYLWTDLIRQRNLGFKSITRFPFECTHTFYHMSLVLQGWARANRIMCLGSLELRWMRRWFPWWRAKLSSYFVALSAEDQRALAAVRSGRQRSETNQLRFLWMGRWEKHKGPRVLLDFIAEWHTKRPQDTFTIAGCGPDAERDCPVELLRSGTINIWPSFTRAALYPMLASHDIGLFTSKVEGWGLSLNEMLESGMTVFATPTGGVFDLEKFCGGRLRAFTSDLRAMQNLPPNGPGLEEYFREFNWKNIAKKYVELFGNIDSQAPQVSTERAQAPNY